MRARHTKAISTASGYHRSAKEMAIHIAVADLLRVAAHPSLIWYHCANEGERTPSFAAKLARMGVIAGVPDFSLTLPDGGRSAFLEIKDADGVLSSAQIEFQFRCFRIGTPFAIAHDLDEAREYLMELGALRQLARAA